VLCLFADFVLALLLRRATERMLALIAGIDLLAPVDTPASAFARAFWTGRIIGSAVDEDIIALALITEIAQFAISASASRAPAVALASWTGWIVIDLIEQSEPSPALRAKKIGFAVSVSFAPTVTVAV
jgi:hypothetical protein